MKVQEVKPKDELCRKIFSASSSCCSTALGNLIALKAHGFFFAQTDAKARAALIVIRMKHPPRLVQARDGCVLRKWDMKRKLDLARAEEIGDLFLQSGKPRTRPRRDGAALAAAQEAQDGGRQRRFFQEGDESELRPMILKDIADKTGLDISTVSRVSNVKYAQTKWGTFPLRFFFTDSYTTGEVEEMSTRKIKMALKAVIEKEDKSKPLSDEALTKLMKEKGFPIARRTIAKYREQLNIPVARLRRG